MPDMEAQESEENTKKSNPCPQHNTLQGHYLLVTIVAVPTNIAFVT
jgi:hypothetical protein